MSKLEELMGRRETADRAASAAHAKAEEARTEKTRRNKRLSERREFNRLFKKLRGMVEGRWDRFGHGWKFKYKGGDFYIAYASWFSAKTPGDVDDYDMSGSNWVLKLGFNGIQGREVTLSHEYEPKGDLTDKVMDGLWELGRKFAKPNGRFYSENGDDE